MAKTPKPWFWKARKAWYVQLNGKQVRLGEDQKKATQEFYRLMAADGKLDDRQNARMTVADACEALLSQVAHYRSSTKRLYTDMLGPFAAEFRGRRLDSIRPDEAIRFVANYQGTGYKGKKFGDSSRALMFRHIKSLFKWARDMGVIQINPFVRTPNPWKIQARERPMSQEEYEKVMADRRLSDRFKEIVEIIWRTGMRPGEIAKLSARHLDSRLPIARFQPTEHKTGTKTGLQREVYFPPDLWERIKKYAELRPTGPLLRNRRGNPWSQDLISDTFGRIKRRLGLECVLYQARHSFLTKLVEGGVPVARAAKIGGHTHPETLMKHYYHPETLKMLEDVEKVNDGEADRMASIRRKVDEERKKARSVFTRKPKDQQPEPPSSADTSPGA